MSEKDRWTSTTSRVRPMESNVQRRFLCPASASASATTASSDDYYTALLEER